MIELIISSQKESKKMKKEAVNKQNQKATDKQIRFLKHLTYKNQLKLVNEDKMTLGEAMRLIPFLNNQTDREPQCFYDYIVLA